MVRLGHRRRVRGFLAPALAPTPLLVLAGVVEGAILGAAQWFVLRRTFPALSARRWIGVTALAAGFAWSVAAVVVGNSGRINALPVPVLLTVIAVAGMSILLAPGIGQWLVLRHHVRDAFVWIWVNAVAWGAGLLVFAAALSTAVALVGALAGAAVTAAITARGLTSVARRPHSMRTTCRTASPDASFANPSLISLSARRPDSSPSTGNRPARYRSTKRGTSRRGTQEPR